MHEIKSHLAELWSADTDEFVELASAAHLDPKHDFIGADLRGMDFSRQNLAGFDFRGADFRGANLEGASFDHAVIDGARFDAGTDPRQPDIQQSASGKMDPYLDAANNASRAEARIRAIRHLARSGIDPETARDLTALRALSDQSGRVIGSAFSAFAEHFTHGQAVNLLRSAAVANENPTSQAEILRLLHEFAANDEEAFLDMISLGCNYPFRYLEVLLDSFSDDSERVSRIVEAVSRHVALGDGYRSSIEILQALEQRPAFKGMLSYVIDNLFQTKIPVLGGWHGGASDDLLRLLARAIASACLIEHRSKLVSLAAREIFRTKLKIGYGFTRVVGIEEIVAFGAGEEFARWLLRWADEHSMQSVFTEMMKMDYYKSYTLARAVLDFRPTSSPNQYPEWPETALMDSLKLIKPRPGFDELQTLIARLMGNAEDLPALL